MFNTRKVISRNRASPPRAARKAAPGSSKPNKKPKGQKSMTNETIETILTAAFVSIPIGSYVIGLGYMIWKGL